MQKLNYLVLMEKRIFKTITNSDLIFNNYIEPVINNINKIEDIPTRIIEIYSGNTFGKIVLKHD